MVAQSARESFTGPARPPNTCNHDIYISTWLMGIYQALAYIEECSTDCCSKGDAWRCGLRMPASNIGHQHLDLPRTPTPGLGASGRQSGAAIFRHRTRKSDVDSKTGLKTPSSETCQGTVPAECSTHPTERMEDDPLRHNACWRTATYAIPSLSDRFAERCISGVTICICNGYGMDHH